MARFCHLRTSTEHHNFMYGYPDIDAYAAAKGLSPIVNLEGKGSSIILCILSPYTKQLYLYTIMVINYYYKGGVIRGGFSRLVTVPFP